MAVIFPKITSAIHNSIFNISFHLQLPYRVWLYEYGWKIILQIPLYLSAYCLFSSFFDGAHKPPWVTSSRLYPWRKLLHSWSLLKKRDLGYFNVTLPIYTDWNRGGNLIQGQKLLGLALEIAVLLMCVSAQPWPLQPGHFHLALNSKLGSSESQLTMGKEIKMIQWSYTQKEAHTSPQWGGSRKDEMEKPIRG